VRVDFAFWTGAGLVVVPGGRGTPTPARRRGRARLEEWCIEVRDYDRDRFAGAADGGLLAYLGPGFSGFWRSERLPRGPRRGISLARPVAALP
jgi:hypothetical protein